MRPMNCNDCPQRRSCQSGMYMEGCSYYGPEERPIGFVEGIRAFFRRFSR